MTTQAWCLLTDEQNTEILGLNGTLNVDPEHPVGVVARQVDNPLANNLGQGTLVGAWLAPARILNDPYYVNYLPYMDSLPIYTWDSDVLFIPFV